MHHKSFKIVVLLAISAILFGFTFADKTSVKDAYSLKFKLKGLKTGDTVLLANYFGDKQYIKDTAIVDAKGYFTFTGKAKLARGIYLIVPASRETMVEIMVADEQNFVMEGDLKNPVANMKVTGSAENTAFYDYQKYFLGQTSKLEKLKRKMDSTQNQDSAQIIRKKLIATEKEMYEYRKTFIKNNPNKLVGRIFKAMMDTEVPETPKLPDGKPDSAFPYTYYKTHYWDGIDLNEDGLIRSPVFHKKLDRYFKQMVLQVPDSINKETDDLIAKVKDKKGEIFKYIVWYITNQYETSNIMGMDAVTVHMYEKYYLTGLATWISEDTENKIRDRYNVIKYLTLGSFAPPMTLPDSSGKNKSITSVKAKISVLVFWAPACGHCQKELPKLSDLYKRVKDKFGLEVYSVNTEYEEKPWKDFIKTNNLTWINVWDPKHTTDFRKLYDITSTPTIYILDENKKIIGKKLGVEQLEDFFINYNKIKSLN